jgi:membrane protease YdiL (CAAX protease family)
MAWLVIFACAAVFAIGAHRGERAQRLRGSTDSVATVQLLLQCRYVVGWYTLFKRNLDQANMTATLMRSVEQAARTAPEKLAITPAIAELKGKEAALAHLDTLAPEIKGVELQRDLETLRTVYERDQLPQDGDRQRLIDRFGWLGRLALTWGQPPDAPERRAVIAAAHRTAIAAVAIVGVVLGGLVAGLALFVTAIVLLVKRRLRPLYRPEPGAPVHYLEAFALYLVAMLGLSIGSAYIVRGGGLAPSAMLLLLALVLVWPAWRLGVARTAKAIGWYLPRGTPAIPPPLPPLPGMWPAQRHGVLDSLPRPLREMTCGVLGYLSGLPVVGAAMIVTLLLARFTESQPTHPIIEAAGRGWRVTLQLYLLACGIAPMIEETFFRGTLQHYLRGRHGFFMSGLVSAVLFAAVHPQGWTTIPVLTSIGFVLSCLREWRGSLLAAMTAHAMNNFTATTFLVVALS